MLGVLERNPVALVAFTEVQTKKMYFIVIAPSTGFRSCKYAFSPHPRPFS
jgi:hypothetical protein